ncbi:MAG: tRNA 2-thiouridine(34) synthase MnmA [Desulfobacteraceae bacterium]|nr:tRNA 2-thiouridine(34) synthase MnmA [Desulfobacteraceae bacterium]
MKIAAAMSGGVDSLRTACLLREQGHEVLGIHMRIVPSAGGDDPVARTIAEREDLLRKLADRCAIPLVFVDFREQFESLVIRPFVDAYRRGLTPNPCILCNPRIKFGLLLDEAMRLGAEKLATGHYVRISSGTERFRLLRARDGAKDQSYFLMGLGQEQLSRAMFPLGGYTKVETFAWAKREGLSGLITEESQEICFVPGNSYPDFIRGRTGDRSTSGPGPILDLNGRILGEHKGIFHYTVGQRRGLGIPSTEPYYVVRIEPEANAVRVGRAQDLFCETCTAREVNWVSIPPPGEPIRCRVRIRNLHRPAPAEVFPVSPDTATIRFDEPQRAVTPGQGAVFYDDELLLGGGIIEA